jgi:hypothetical protein
MLVVMFFRPLSILYVSLLTVRFFNQEGVTLFQIGKDQTGADTFDTVDIKNKNSVAVSSGDGSNRCITIIDIESKEQPLIVLSSMVILFVRFS